MLSHCVVTFLASVFVGSNAFFKGSELQSGDIDPFDHGVDMQQIREDVKEGEDELSASCMAYAAISEEVAQGAQANERQRRARHEGGEQAPLGDDSNESNYEPDPKIVSQAAEEDAVASNESDQAGADDFDDIFSAEAADDDDSTEDDESSEDLEESEDRPERFMKRFATLLRSIFGEAGNESMHMAVNESLEDSEESCANPLTEDEKKMAKCPPGEYLGHNTKYSTEKREARLRKALCLAKARGFRRGVDPENKYYLKRGYMTYESSIWPKPHMCRTLPDRSWYLKHKSGKRYRPDRAPESYTKEVCHKYKIEFHKSWKVASTSFPDYLRCQYDCQWETPKVDKEVGNDYMIVAAVREPIARFVSAANELLERSINHYCPTGKCGKSDGYVYGTADGSTHDKYLHQTSWFKNVAPAAGGYSASKLRNLVQNMVKDTVCNYYTYASEHLSTQASFITQNGGPAKRIHRILKLENINQDLEKMHKAATPKSSKTCKLGLKNVKACKPNQERMPSENAFLNVLKKDKALLREICLVYAQDFICFDYNLPLVCKGMF